MTSSLNIVNNRKKKTFHKRNLVIYRPHFVQTTIETFQLEDSMKNLLSPQSMSFRCTCKAICLLRQEFPKLLYACVQLVVHLDSLGGTRLCTQSTCLYYGANTLRTGISSMLIRSTLNIVWYTRGTVY